MHNAFLHRIKLSGYKVKVKFDKELLAVKQNNYANKIVNSYIVCDLNNWPNIPSRNFTFKNFLFGATSIGKTSDEEKWVYIGYGIAFNGKVRWNFSGRAKQLCNQNCRCLHGPWLRQLAKYSS